TSTSMYNQIAANKRKTIVLMVVFLVVVTALSWLFSLYIGRPSITMYVLIGGLIYALISYFAASGLALALNNAKAVEKSDNPRLYRIVENLAITDGLPTPKIYSID